MSGIEETRTGDRGDDGTCKTDRNSEEEEKLAGPLFVPRLCLQRYYFVQQTLSKLKAEQIVDFGSAECRIARFLVQIPTAVDISLVDIDKTLLEQSKWCIRPMTCDYIIRREKPLTVKIFEGSVTQYDSGLKNFDVVTMVEIVFLVSKYSLKTQGRCLDLQRTTFRAHNPWTWYIEHLIPDVLNAAVANVFGIINPRVVVITTPNADFNVLFPGFSGFRHWDHKFEWTQAEFQYWCGDIANRYDYTVEYSGIGEAPSDSKHLGCCSQAAVFTRKSPVKTALEEGTSVDCYSLIAECSYPYKISDDSTEDSLLCEIEFILRQFQIDDQFEDYDSNCLVPVTTLLRFKQIKIEFTENSLRDCLRNHGYRISEDGDNIILPAIPKYSQSDLSDSDNDIEVKESVIGEESIHPDEEEKSNSDAEFWD